MGTPRYQPCVPWPVQLRDPSPLTSEDYVAGKAWENANLVGCPRHSAGGCGFARHGTYRRTTPAGMAITRYYCPTAHETFSLLPDCLASRFPGTLTAMEDVVAHVEGARSVEAAADVLRPDVGWTSAVRWIRRRLRVVRATLVTVVTLLPALLGVAAQVTPVRTALDTDQALVRLRTDVDAWLHAVPRPLGFAPPRPTRSARVGAGQHDMGADAVRAVG